MEFIAPNASSLINYDGGGTNTLRLIDCKSMNIGAGNDAVVSANAAAVILQLCLFIGGRDHLRVSGTSNSALLLRTCGFFSFTGDGIGYGISTWNDCLSNNQYFFCDSGYSLLWQLRLDLIHNFIALIFYQF